MRLGGEDQENLDDGVGWTSRSTGSHLMRLYVRQEEGSHLQELVRVARRVQSLQQYLIHDMPLY